MDNVPQAAHPTKKHKRTAIVASALGLALAVGAALAYFLYLKPPTASELYSEAVRNALSIESDNNYGSFDVDSGTTKVQGEFTGELSGDYRIRTDLDLTYSSEGIPMSASIELLGIEEGEVSEMYFKRKSLTSSDPEYRPYVEEYFRPTLGKWVKANDSDEDEAGPVSFKEQGATAAFESLAIFAPLTRMNEADKELYLAGIEKYDLYQVEEDIEGTRFKGIAARKIRVSVDKDAFIEFEREMSETLSEDVGYTKFETAFVNSLFGRGNRLTGDIYLKPEAAQIIGLEVKIDLPEPIIESVYGTQLEKINTSLLIEYDRKSTIEAPEAAISEDELNALIEL